MGEKNTVLVSDKTEDFQTDAPLVWKQAKMMCPYLAAEKDGLFRRCNRLAAILKLYIDKGFSLNKEVVNSGIAVVNFEIGKPNKDQDWDQVIALLILFWKYGEKLSVAVNADLKNLKEARDAINAKNTELWTAIDAVSKFAQSSR